MLRVLALCSLAFVLACDRDWQSPSAPGRLEAATPPSVVGSYNATFVGTITGAFGERSTYTCPGSVDIPTQADSTFSGGFTEAGSTDCQQESGTIAGAVRPDGGVTFTADLPGGGTDIWQDGAERLGCTLVSSTPFRGTLTGGTLSAEGNGVYDCWFGTVNVDIQVSATRT